MNTELNPIEFKANKETGECFASQRVVAKMCGVSQSTIRDFCHSRKLEVKQGLTPKMLQEATQYYAKKGRKEAINTLCKLAEYGAQRFIFNAAGVPLPEAKQQPKTAIQMLVETAQAMAKLEQEQLEHDKRLKAIEAKQSVIDRVVYEFTVMAYFVYANLGDIDLKTATALGRKVSRYCKSNGFPIGKQPDPRFGRVNAYPEHALITILKKEGYIPE